MEFQDHAYTSTTYDRVNPVEFTYKSKHMSSKEIEDFVKLRVSNSYLFSGRRNASMWAWRAILSHMGLQHKMTHCQASKKWENMKKRYKELKNPPDGVKVFPETWPYFTLMDNAMEGRLEGNAPILKAFPSDKDNCNFLSISKPKKRKLSMVSSPTPSGAGVPEIKVSLNGDEEEVEGEEVQNGSKEISHVMQEADDERNMIDSERCVMQREQQVMLREVLQRKRVLLEREIASLDRDRASLERERATIEREKAVIERERMMVEKDKNALSRDRLALELEKARLERLVAPKGRTEEVTEDSSKVTHSDVTDRRERLLYLFEKLVEHF
uniref:uncharacterized protein LOC109959780 n=1 Tax=Monopterus albus TaxID=43700 RepID=UPI0009B352D2|nr:uncharacterized protein LOC109959780 [Monopterus albus]